ncbi:MAG: hypothetical protein ABFD92_07420 [Planctomycetaceae bacterium]|nr:hypothetical protein [Planctomycetaceae bacterium]
MNGQIHRSVFTLLAMASCAALPLRAQQMSTVPQGRPQLVAVPSDASCDLAKAALADVLNTIEQAQTQTQRAALAPLLLQKAATLSYPAQKYILLERSAHFAAMNGDSETLAKTMQAMAWRYIGDWPVVHGRKLAAGITGPLWPGQFEEMAQETLAIADKLATGEQWEVAEQMIKAVSSGARARGANSIANQAADALERTLWLQSQKALFDRAAVWRTGSAAGPGLGPLPGAGK